MKRFLLVLAIAIAATPAHAVQWLKQSTAATVKVGPFVDDTDGVTAETGLTVSQADIRLSKNGGAFAQTNNATGATHDENGYYGVPLDATDTGTLGTLKVAVAESGALPVWQEFMVVPANVYDSLVGGSDYIETNVKQVDDTAASSALASAADIVNEWESQSQADPTGFQVNVKEINSVTAATPGATGGLLIAGTNAATTFTSSSGSALTISSTGGNGHGIAISGNGTGEGISVTGGATGHAFELIGGATSGSGLRVTTTSGDGIYVAAQGGTSDAMNLIGATLGNGITVEGDVGIDITGNGAAGIQLAGATYGFDIDNGFDVAGGMAIANSAGTALTLTSSGSNGHGLLAQGNGTGEGFSLIGGATGNGLQAYGGSTSGSGFVGGTQGTGHGMSLSVGGGANGNGLYAVGSGSGHGMHLTAGASGEDAYLTNATNTSLGDAIDQIYSDSAAILVDTGTTLDGKIDTIDTTADAVLVDTGTTLPATLAGLDSGSFYSTTVDSVTSTTQYVLTDTPPSDADLLNQMAVFYDSNGDPSPRLVTAYASSSGTITVRSAPGFTVVSTDAVKFYPVSEYLDTLLSDIDAQVNIGPVNFLPVSDYYTLKVNRRGGITPTTSRNITAGETVAVQFAFNDILNRRLLTSVAAPTSDSANVTIDDYGINGVGDGGKGINVVLDCTNATAGEEVKISVSVTAGGLTYKASHTFTIVE